MTQSRTLTGYPATRMVVVMIIGLVLWFAAGFASAQNNDFLNVSDAFRASVSRDGPSLAIRWQIADGYYLYRHALRFESDPADSLAQARIPDGDKHHDEFFGEVETYRDHLEVVVPLADQDTPPDTITVTYQGCADLGLCYPPQTETFDVPPDTAALAGSVSPRAETMVATTATGSTPNTGDSPTLVSEQDRLAHVIEDASLFWVVVSFLGLGLLLAFTPCVLPMIPILSGIVVGRGEQASAMRGFLLSSAYVVAMALAYTVFGVLAGLFGANLQALLQSPWTLVPFALVFVALAASMFGLYQLQLPSAWQTRLNRVGRGREGGVAGAAVLGFVSALIVGPCLAPPLAGALLYIGASGDAVLGGLALFALGLGMGIPLIALGTLGGGVLPRTGAWMNQIKQLFGVILLGVALWLLARILPGPLILALWGALLLCYGVHLGALSATAPTSSSATRLRQSAGLLLVFYAALLLLGAASGSDRPLQPLDRLAQRTTTAHRANSGDAVSSPFTRVSNRAELDAALAAAARAGRPAVVDFYADWCVECVQMEHTVFADPAVHDALGRVAALQVDVTHYDAGDRALLKSLGVFGPPTILFFDAAGEEARAQRRVGTVDAPDLIDTIRTLGGAKP